MLGTQMQDQYQKVKRRYLNGASGQPAFSDAMQGRRITNYGPGPRVKPEHPSASGTGLPSQKFVDAINSFSANNPGMQFGGGSSATTFAPGTIDPQMKALSQTNPTAQTAVEPMGSTPGANQAGDQPQPDPASGQIAANLTRQGVNTANFGNQFMKKAGEYSRGSTDAGNEFIQGSRGDFAEMMNQARMANDPRLSANVSDMLGRQLTGAQSDVERYFTEGDPVRKAAARMAQGNVDALVGGTAGSRGARQIDAEIQRGLIRDKAAALLGVNQQNRQNELDQLNQARAANLGLANTFGQTGTSRGNLGINALGQGANILNALTATGGSIANQGFQNQIAGIQTGSALDQQKWQNDMATQQWLAQLEQQKLQNIQANKANKFNKKNTRKMMEQALAAQGGGLGSALGTGIGAIGGAIIGGPAGASIGAGIGGGIGGAF